MSTISIKTAQHVSIDYELATWVERLLAFFLDFIIIVFAGFAFFFLFAFAFDDTDIAGGLTIAILSVYTLVSEMITKGLTIGKKALKIRVVNLSGEAMELSSYALRWSFRFLDIYLSFGAIATLVINTTAKGQRFGDILAHTAVIKEKESSPVFLREIMQLKDKNDVEITYPNVGVFNEEEMLFAKNTLDRVKKYKNEAHFQALDKMCLRMCERLGITQIPKNKERFIRQVISDYILSTR